VAIYFLLKIVHPTLNPTGLLFNVHLCSFLGVNRPGCDVNHPSSSNVEVKNEWSYDSAPPRTPFFRGQGQIAPSSGSQSDLFSIAFRQRDARPAKQVGYQRVRTVSEGCPTTYTMGVVSKTAGN